MVADAAFAGAAVEAVLDAIAFKMGDGAVIQAYGNVNDENFFRVFQGANPWGQLTKIGGDAVYLLQKNTPWTGVFCIKVRRNIGIGLLCHAHTVVVFISGLNGTGLCPALTGQTPAPLGARSRLCDKYADTACLYGGQTAHSKHNLLLWACFIGK